MNKGFVYSVLLMTGALLIFIGALAKIQHWDGGNILIISGMVLSVATTIISLLPLLKQRDTTDRLQ